MKVTPDSIRATYVYLRSLPPFSAWKLPAPGKLRFEVTADTNTTAEYDPNTRALRVNADRTTNVTKLLMNVAHEMIHLKQDLEQVLHPDDGKHHDRYFQSKARQVCLKFGFDPDQFS